MKGFIALVLIVGSTLGGVIATLHLAKVECDSFPGSHFTYIYGCFIVDADGVLHKINQSKTIKLREEK